MSRGGAQSLAWWLAANRHNVSGDRLNVPDKRGELVFRDYGADVLLVAHLDHVGEHTRRTSKWDNARRCMVDVEPEPIDAPMWFGNRYVRHVSLDDRLGCWAIERLHASGVHVDLLFTDCEETGRTTGREFNPPRQYKFILSLDRMGDDAVLYQYLSAKRWRRRCHKHFGTVNHGSFSCIASMEHLGVCGVNVGVGYFQHNTHNCWADIHMALRQIDKARAFIADARSKEWRFVDTRPAYTSRAPSYAGYALDEYEALQWELWELGGYQPDDWPRALPTYASRPVKQHVTSTDRRRKSPREVNGNNGGVLPFRSKVQPGVTVTVGKRVKSRVHFTTAHNEFTHAETAVRCDETDLLVAEDTGRDRCTGPCQCDVDPYDYCAHGWPSRTAAIFG